MSCSFKLDILKKTIKRKEFSTALELNQEFKLDLKKVLFDAIGNDEEFAMSLIKEHESLSLPLGEANEYNKTLLFLACDLEKLKIAEAILTKGGKKNLFSADKEDIRNMLNARDDNGWTPFLWACIKKRPKVVDLLMKITRKLYIEDSMLQAIDESGKSGCDHFPEHFKTDSDSD